MPVQLLQCRRHGIRIDDHFIPFIGLLELLQITLHRLALAHTAGAAGGLELGTVDGYPLTPYQARRTRKANQRGPRLGGRFTMHTPEFGDALVIGSQPAQQPHHFHVPPALGLQTS
jgi:hypothetical protein